jgi:beta-lactam-binding protein with PASTA domain
LGAAGFSVSHTTKDVTKQNQDGVVIAQSPDPGTTAKKHSAVAIVIGQFVPPNTATTTTTTTSSTTTTTPTTTTTTTPP